MKENEMQKIIAKNLMKLQKEHNLTNRQLAKIANVSESTVGKWILQKSTPRMGAIQKIADHFELPKSYILSEEVKQYAVSEKHGALEIHEKHSEYNKAQNLHEIPFDSFVEVPILGEIACGDPIYAVENFAGYRSEPKSSLPSGKAYYLRAKGTSMEPTIPNGAWVLVREQPDVETGEIAAVLVDGNAEATLKRVRKQGENVMLVPDNPTYDTIFVSEDYPARIIGKAVRFTQDL